MSVNLAVAHLCCPKLIAIIWTCCCYCCCYCCCIVRILTWRKCWQKSNVSNKVCKKRKPRLNISCYLFCKVIGPVYSVICLIFWC